MAGRKVEDAPDNNKNGTPDELEDDKKTVSDTQISQAQAMANSASESGPNTTPAVHADPKMSGQVYVKLLAKSYVRHDYEAKKTHKYRNGDKFWITEVEFEKLSSGERPRVEETEED